LAEVTRAVVVANAARGRERARTIVLGCRLVDPDRFVIDEATRRVNLRLRTLDALHLASALLVEPEEFVAYDHRLLAAAAEAGLSTVSPGA
jgi:predicted nucleic acid-binding protein